jgi:glycosyltransferase involved in cell wall biosynthesis
MPEIPPVPSPGSGLAGVRTALVHDWLNQDGGAEAVLGVLHDLLPSAPIYTTIFDPRRVPLAAEPGWDVRVSPLDRLPGIHGHHQPYLPLYPLAWSATRLRQGGKDFDLVLSNKSGFCHGVRAGRAVHVCYCLTPTRFVWDLEDYLAHERVPAAGRLAVRAALPALRRWDRAAAQGVDHFIAISRVVADRVREAYGRESTVIHPPVEVAAVPQGGEAEDFWLVLARLIPYKRIDLAVQAFSRLGRKLVVVGDGRDRERLQHMAGPTIEFRGRLPRTEVLSLLSRCRGLVWPGIEDFGLAPVEAMAAGRPVVARRGGGVLDTVEEGISGMFFEGADPNALAAAVEEAEARTWQPRAIRAQAERFSRPVFEQRLVDFLRDTLRTQQQLSDTSPVLSGTRSHP